MNAERASRKERFSTDVARRFHYFPTGGVDGSLREGRDYAGWSQVSTQTQHPPSTFPQTLHTARDQKGSKGHRVPAASKQWEDASAESWAEMPSHEEAAWRSPITRRADAGLPMNHSPGKQRQCGKRTEGSLWISKCPEGPDRTSE